MIEAINLKKVVSTQAGDLIILKGLDLKIKAGETVAIVGVSGSGKSTLLGLLAGLDDATEGQILLDGEDLTAMDEEARARVRAAKVGFVFQNFQLLPNLTALENVMLPLELQHARDARERASSYLDRVGLSHRWHHYPRQLSGGEQQRVAIARAFASQPRILFADEPTGNLDQQTGAAIIDLLFDLNQQFQTTLVLVTHDEKLSKRCLRRLNMEEGKLFE